MGRGRLSFDSAGIVVNFEGGLSILLADLLGGTDGLDELPVFEDEEVFEGGYRVLHKGLLLTHCVDSACFRLEFK